MLRTNLALRLLEGSYASSFCVPDDMLDRELAAGVWARLSALSLPDFDPEETMLAEYRHMTALLEGGKQLLAGYRERPGTTQEVLTELSSVRAAAARADGVPDPALLSRTFALGIRFVFASLLEIVRLSLPDAREEYRRLDDEVRTACRRAGKGELAWRLMKSVFSGHKLDEPGSFSQLGVDLVWERARCMVLIDPVSRWEYQLIETAEARAFKVLAVARLAGEDPPELAAPGPDGKPGTDDDISIPDPCLPQK